MAVRKILAGALALALLLAANVRVVYAVAADGEAQDGLYRASDVRLAREEAARAAEEIARGDAAPPEVTRRVRLTLRAPDGDPAALTEACLARTGGVDAAWAVTVDGVPAGVVADPSALGEVLEVLLAEGASREAVTARFSKSIVLRRVFVPAGEEDDLMAVSRLVRDLTEVVSVTADGTTHVR